MSYATVMVHLDLDHANDARLRIAGDFAEQFGAKVIGVAAADPKPSHYAGGSFAQRLVAFCREEIEQQMNTAEERFHAALNGRASEIEWRGAMMQPGLHVLREARAADLIVTGNAREQALANPLRHLDLADLLMRVGRPVFVVPPEVEYLKLKCAMIAWQDKREARRAIIDALPLLHKAEEIAVVEVVSKDESRGPAHARVNDVTAWLGRHGIEATGKVFHVSEEEKQIDELWRYGADFMVSGAYGHSRLREWILGGFTRSVLSNTRHPSLLSH